MPPRPELAGTAQAVCNWTGPGGVKAANVLHCYTAAAPTAGDMVNLASGIFDGFTLAAASLISCVGPNWYLQNVTCTELTGIGTEGVSTQAARAGGEAAQDLSPNVSVVLSWHIYGRYRGGHPRTYMPGVPSDNTTVAGGNNLSAAKIANWVAAAQLLLAHVNGLAPGAGGTWALGSMQRTRTTGTPPVKTTLNPPVFMPFQSVSVNQRLASQRRRLGKYGA